MRTLILMIALGLMTAGSLTACNTVEGVGRDVERAGEKIQEL